MKRLGSVPDLDSTLVLNLILHSDADYNPLWPRKSGNDNSSEVVFPETQNHKYLRKTHRLMKYDRYTIEKIDHSDIDIYLNSSDDDQIYQFIFSFAIY